MLVRAPLVEAEQHRSIRIEDLTKVVMMGRRLRLAEERLVPFEAARNVAYADDRPRAFHRISAVGLTRHKGSERERWATPDASKGWMANTQTGERSLARGSLHRMVSQRMA